MSEKKKKRILITAGGTGGHLFPAQSLAAELSSWDVLFVAGGLDCNRYFDREAFAFETIPCATFSLSNPFALFKGCCKIAQGVSRARRVIQKFSPDLIVGFGSFYTLPVLAAALLEKIPYVLHEQNTTPGKVNRLFAPFAKKIALTFPPSSNDLKRKRGRQQVEVLFPLRKAPCLMQPECWEYFGLTPSLPTLLVFGGSQGAERLNTLFLDSLAGMSPIQVLHFTGNTERADRAELKYRELNIRACVKPFERHMERAMQIADAAITRAGAATIAELIEYTLPALLVPYPFATANHQEENGAHFVSQVKGGKMYKESALEPSILAQYMRDLLAERAKFKENIRVYKQQRQTLSLSTLIEELCTRI